MFAVATRIHTTSPSTLHRLTDMGWIMYMLWCQLEVPAQPELPPLWGDVEFEAWHTREVMLKVPRVVVFHLCTWHHLHFIDLLITMWMPRRGIAATWVFTSLATNQTRTILWTMLWTSKPCTDVGGTYSPKCAHAYITCVHML